MISLDLTRDEIFVLTEILRDEPNVLRARNYGTPEEGSFNDVVDVLLMDKLIDIDTGHY